MGKVELFANLKTFLAHTKFIITYLRRIFMFQIRLKSWQNSSRNDSNANHVINWKGIAATHAKSRDEVEIVKEQFELTNVWRVFNPDAVHFPKPKY